MTMRLYSGFPDLLMTPYGNASVRSERMESPVTSFMISVYFSDVMLSRRSLMSTSLPLPTQYAFSSHPSLTKYMMLYGLYTSASPKRYPSYHLRAASNLSPYPKSARMPFTSDSTNPNLSSDFLENTLFTTMLFRSEKMLCLAICITPVT